MAEVSDTSFWSSNGASRHLQDLIAATLSNGNGIASFEGSVGGCIVEQGAGAGNPLTDVLFAIAFMRVIIRLRAASKKAGLITTIVVNGASNYVGLDSEGHIEGGDEVVELDDVSYADDLAFTVAAPADTLPSSLKEAGNIMWKVHEECGFRLSWGAVQNGCYYKMVWAGRQK